MRRFMPVVVVIVWIQTLAVAAHAQSKLSLTLENIYGQRSRAVQADL